MLRVLTVILMLCCAGAPVAADGQAVRDRVVAELRGDGYGNIRMFRTWLGRLRFVASRDGAEREVVVNPVTGVVLRDYVRQIRGRTDERSDRSPPGKDDEDDDDDSDDDDDDGGDDDDGDDD
ncbi:MAG: hypothetical protein OIF48_06160 [Silicimonas sp.]|nr:hypothetical protein [Silicimonas sp.]